MSQLRRSTTQTSVGPSMSKSPNARRPTGLTFDADGDDVASTHSLEPKTVPNTPRTMKSVQSSSTFSAIRASLQVELEHQLYYPGAIVRGTVRFNVRKPTKFFALRLRISGKESMVIRMKHNAADILTRQRETFWKQLYTLEGTSKTHQLELAEIDRQQSLVATKCSMRVSSQTAASVAPPGEYVYPFEFQIPPWVPPSFEEYGDDEDYAAVLYYAKAYLDVPGGGDSDLIGRTFYRVISRIGKQQWKEGAKPLADHQTHSIKGCCGMSKGTVKVSVEVPRRVISIGDDGHIPYRVVVNNQEGQEPVNRIIVYLLHVMTVRADGQTEVRQKTLAEQTDRCLIEPGKTGGIIGKLAMPDDVPPSIEGILFSSEYTFVVECDVPFATDPVTRCGITFIHRAESKETVPVVSLNGGYSQMNGVCEYTYQCPEYRENELCRLHGGASTESGTFGAMFASGSYRRDGPDDEPGNLDSELMPPPEIDRTCIAKRQPDVGRWSFAPPPDYS